MCRINLLKFLMFVTDWRDVIRVGAVDCANDANNQLCRDLEVMYYPMIKLFPPNSDETFLGETYDKGTVDEMRKAVVTKLITHQKSLDKVESRVNLKPLTHSNLDDQLWNDLPSDVMYLVLVSEPEDSTVGSEVVLDLSRTREVIIRLLSPSNVHLSQVVGIEQGSNGVVVVERDLSLTKLKIVDFTRITLNKAVREFLISHGVEVPPDLPVSEVVIAPEVNIGDVMAIMQMEEEIKKQLQTKTLSTVAFQIDLEGAIRYSLKNEVPLHRNITGVQLNALKNYLAVLIKYFPIGQHGVDFLKHLNRVGIGEKEEVRGKEFRQTFLQLENEYKPFLAEQGWIGCRGSKPEFRGYPCSLWTLFHALTVHEEIIDRHKPKEVPEVVDAMAGYIKNFFTCSDCAAHFTEMAKTIAGNVTTQNDSILWLWSAHNRVNMRLAGDATEDPEHKKVQFPSKEACPACHTTDGSWNKTEVLKFLKHMFSNIVYIQKNDLTTSTTTVAPSAKVEYDKSLRNEIYGEELGYTHKQVDKRTAWDFNVFDISLCVVLYVCSVAILILVCIKFVFKRSYRKKPYIHDILSKV